MLTGLDILQQAENNSGRGGGFSMDQQELTVEVLAIWLLGKFGKRNKQKSTVNKGISNNKGIKTCTASPQTQLTTISSKSSSDPINK